MANLIPARHHGAIGIRLEAIDDELFDMHGERSVRVRSFAEEALSRWNGKTRERDREGRRTHTRSFEMIIQRNAMNSNRHSPETPRIAPSESFSDAFSAGFCLSSVGGCLTAFTSAQWACLSLAACLPPPFQRPVPAPLPPRRPC